MNRNSTAEYLDRLAGAWADWALASSWQIALLVVLVTLVALASRRLSARFRYLLWMLVLIKALTPPTLGTFWSVGNWAGPDLWPHYRATVSSHFDAPESLAVDFSSQPVDAMDTGAVEPPLKERAIDPPVNAANTPAWSMRAVALAVWLAGFAMFTLFIAVRYWRLTHALKRAAVVDEGPLRVALERLAMRLGWGNPPELLLSGAVGSPFLFGLLRPRIVLPESLPETLEPGRLEDVLLHELTHWRRRDLAASWLQILVQSLFWFHPLVWLAGAQLRHERECACDEAVLASGCSQARRYGESLLRVLMAARGRSSAVLGFLGIFERNTRMQRRLEEIMNQENKVRRLGVGGWLALALFAVACLPMAAVENKDISPYSNIAGGMVALQFDGQREYLEVENSTLLTLKPTTIIEGWIKVHETAGETTLLSKEDSWKSGYSIIITGVPGQESFDLMFGLGCRQRFVNLTAPGAIPRDKWTHVMAIYGPGGNELWVNLKEVARQDRPIFYTPAQDVPLRIGKASADLKRYFNGEIASIRFWRVDPYHRDVNYYRVPLDGDENGLIAAWDFFQGDGSLTDKGAGKLKAISKKGNWPKYVALTGLEIKPKSEVRLYGTGSQWQRPFVNDPDVLGHWTAVDVVDDIKWFDPGRKRYPGDLYLKALDFEPDGKMKQVWSWTRGWLWHPGDKFEGQYEIRVIDGKPYLFMELIKGNVTIHGTKPEYMVFEKPSAAWGPKVTFDMIRGDEKTFHNARFRLVRIEEGNKNDRFDDTAEIAVLTDRKIDNIILQELDTQFQGDYEITVDDVIPNTVSPGDGRAQITIRYAPDASAQSQPKPRGGTPVKVETPEPVFETRVYRTGPQWERPFVNDPDALGHWTAVDFVKDISQFSPDGKQWKGDLYVKEFDFLSGGKTKHSWQSWTRGWLWHSGDKAEGKYEIRTIDGRPYLFMEWISGDVTERGMKPHYYVFAKTGDLSKASQVNTSGPPRIVATSPEVGATGVDPATTEITVTFDRDMGGGMSWTGGGPDFPPAPEGARATWIDKRTCVRPVKLEAGHYYRIGINSTSYQNFASADGVPARPSAIYFCTTGASPELEAKVIKPRIVAMDPPNGATDVDPGLTELRVTFSVPMGGGFSWTGGGPQYPEGRDGQRPHWSDDGRTCIRPVSLEPGKIYRLGLNSPSHKNFASRGGVPLDPAVYTFQTRQ